MRLKAHDPRSKHIKLDYDLEWGSLLSTTSYMQRHETKPDDEAEALEYYSPYMRANEQYVGKSYPAFDRTDPATFQRPYVILDARAAFTHNNWEGDLFVDNVCERRADLSKFISDNCDASSRTRMLTYRPRTIGISLQRSF
jgi:hypothetical protein